MRFTPPFGEAVQGIRKMRGVTQAHLVRLADGSYYVVKFANNPVGERVLVNELVSSLLLGELGIETPKAALIRVDEDFLHRNPEVLLTREGVPYRVTPGWHFGSRFPGDPSATAVFDFMPDVMLRRVANRDDFLGVLLFDLWTCNAGPRQAIFFREKPDDSTATSQPAVRWIAQMIDHDRVFEGARWRFSQTGPRPLNWQRIVGGRRLPLWEFAPWIARMQALSDQVFQGILQCVPAGWIRGEEREVQELIAVLRARRNRVPALLVEALTSLPEAAARRSRAPGSVPATASSSGRKPQ